MYLHWSNFGVDIATFSKPVNFKVNLLSLVARIRKIELDLVKSQKLIPAKSSEYQNGKICTRKIVTIRYSVCYYSILYVSGKVLISFLAFWPQKLFSFPILTAFVCATKFWPSQNVKTIANCQQQTLTLLEMSERSQTYRCKVYSQIMEARTCLFVLLLYLVTSLCQLQVRHIH